MAWLIDVSLPVKFPDGCALCNDESAVATTMTDHQNVVGVGVGWMIRDLRLQIPCGARCRRRLRVLRIAFWSLFLAPWILFTALSLHPPASMMRWGVVPLLLVIAALNAIGYLAFIWRWWLRRSVRLIDVRGPAATLAIRNEASARKLAAANGATMRRARWTG